MSELVLARRGLYCWIQPLDMNPEQGLSQSDNGAPSKVDLMVD